MLASLAFDASQFGFIDWTARLCADELARYSAVELRLLVDRQIVFGIEGCGATPHAVELESLIGVEREGILRMSGILLLLEIIKFQVVLLLIFAVLLRNTFAGIFKVFGCLRRLTVNLELIINFKIFCIKAQVYVTGKAKILVRSWHRVANILVRLL